MRYVFSFIGIFVATILPATAVNTRNAAARSATASPNAEYNYNYMYPYMNNQMRAVLNPGVSPSQGSNPINVITKTEQLSAPRRVVARSSARSATSTGASTARVATASAPQTTTTARAATPTATTANASQSRRVVARRNTNTARSARGDASYIAQTAANAAEIETTYETLPSSRCLADYTECMNGYCQRENTAYNRCYCSAKLSQIDAEYQTSIDNLIKQILTLRGTNTWTQQEMDKYWMDTVGKYSGENSWTNIENALNIDWAGTESRVRGQQAFATGHDYCVQHLRGCYYMAANLRDAYRSEIARDCAVYETSLQRLKNAAESLLESYK